MAVAVVDLGYGDAGKGTIVDYLASEAATRGERPLVVRFNGGPQAAHHVTLESGHVHRFSQFGSGTLQGGDTYLSRFMSIDPISLLNEASGLFSRSDLATDRIAVDEDCLVITPYHVAANRAREVCRGQDRHGTTGYGYGECQRLALEGIDLRARHLRSVTMINRKLREIRDAVFEEWGELEIDDANDQILRWVYGTFTEDIPIVTRDYLAKEVRNGREVILEGAQGVLLDENHGFHPYTTWSTTTFRNAQTLMVEAAPGDYVERIGVLRTYTTRHGPGPHPTAGTLTVPEAHNKRGPWMGDFRVGEFDAVAHRYAIEVAEPDSIALTHLDRYVGNRYCAAWQGKDWSARWLAHVLLRNDPDLERRARWTRRFMLAEPVWSEFENDELPSALEKLLETPVSIVSTGPTASDKYRRSIG